ncbi:citrate synthase family protein [Duganella callida]|uniref:citrate synthase (unknown stereospecificity) n=1 Tax=Duganella callida TaxID=2561932 RepID=A0A4Y9SDX1_9BURK|nr:citrate synthase family protein [Duganella callida]TFW18017.1 citrate synthase [Duganella callida]
MVWMTAAEALHVLNVRPQTLYASVSRGKIRARPDADDPRRSLYHRDDVLRMARRANGRRKVEAVSTQAMQYGDPVLPSAISTALDGRLLYRGHDAITLADTASLEDIAALLWQCDTAGGASGNNSAPAGGCAAAAAGSLVTARTDTFAVQAVPAPSARSALEDGLLALARRSAIDPPSLGRPVADLRVEAATVVTALVDAIAGPAAAPHAAISRRLAGCWNAQPHEDLLRRALVLMADHELNASTFACRVAISTGASLAAGVLAGFTTLTGPLHGGAAREFALLAAQARQSGAAQAVHEWLADRHALPGFGHPLYPDGDPRAQALIKLLPKMEPYASLASAAELQAGELPNIDYALSLLTASCGLPDEAPFVLFAVGRCVGWLAHALEQVQANRLIRPRARYTGPVGINAGIC